MAIGRWLLALGQRLTATGPEASVKIILGLGNPGREYESTRHNVGWWLLDHLADVWRFDGWRRDGPSRVASGRVGSDNVRLVKPQTYMNLSGNALRPYTRRANWNAAADLLVVLDDVALPLGRFRVRARGSHGGHNGLRSVETALGNRDYARLRIGIGPAPRHADLADFVLAPFTKMERKLVETMTPRLTDAVETWVRDGVIKAMNEFNRIEDNESQ